MENLTVCLHTFLKYLASRTGIPACPQLGSLKEQGQTGMSVLLKAKDEADRIFDPPRCSTRLF